MSELGEVLRGVRRDRRISSQEQLAALSGVSSVTIKKLESGAIKEPRASTLRLLARGLATDLDGRADPEVTEALYARLMRAAGQLPAERQVAPPGVSRDAFIREMERRTGRHDLAVALSTVAWDYETIPDHLRAILEAAILGVAGAHESGQDG